MAFCKRHFCQLVSTLARAGLYPGMSFAAKAIGAYILLKMKVSRVPFIRPDLPKLRASPPTGDGWLYELKFDGYRTQLHKAGLSSAVYGRNGGDFTRRFPGIAAAVLGLPTKSAVIDDELIAAGRHGQPDFLALLHGRHVPALRLDQSQNLGVKGCEPIPP
jgi:ATP-dependent DNA ligase